MKKALLLFICVVTATNSYAQIPKNENPEVVTIDTTETGRIDTIIEQLPYFPGGQNELVKYLGASIKYPQIARNANTQGTVFLSFVIDENGEVTRINVLRGLSGPGANECEQEAIRVVSEMPVWAPGMQNRKAVKVQYQLPIKFYLSPRKKKKDKKKKN